MPGPSAGDAPAATRFPDRWSLAISSLLILGLLLATAAMVQNWRSAPPDSQPSVPPPRPVSAPPRPIPQALAIRLPPPPVVTRPAVSTPQARPRIVVPLRQAAKQRRPPAKPHQPDAIKITPLKPAVPVPVVPARSAPRVQKEIDPEQSAPKTPTQEPVIKAAQHRKTGGALLRLLEHGKGPSVEIAWPVSAAERRQLFTTLTSCYGMRPAVLARKSLLYDGVSAPGQPWSINRDRYSGFIRSPRGEPIAEENRHFASIARRHDLSDWRPVRVFPRSVDAVLLGGLGNLLGARYQTARQIRAVYELRRDGLRLTGFRVDGDALPGAITLSAIHRNRCD